MRVASFGLVCLPRTRNAQLATRNCTCLLVLTLIASAGCTHVREEAFFGRYLEPPPATPPSSKQPPGAGLVAPNQGGDAVLAQGSVISDVHGERIRLRFTNHSRQSLRFSYVEDQYLAKSARGRALALDKDEFLTYPDVVKPGEEHSVTLLLPKELPASDIVQLLVSINHGKTIIAVKPVGPEILVAGPGGVIRVVPAAASANSFPSVAAAEPAGRVPVIPEPVEIEPLSPGPPQGAMPVVVEFQQVLGSALTLETRWDASKDMVRLASGDRQMFYVMPGQHELTLSSRIASIGETAARVPVVVGPDTPLRVVVEAEARLRGIELRVRVFRGDRMVFERKFIPAAHGPSAS